MDAAPGNQPKNNRPSATASLPSIFTHRASRFPLIINEVPGYSNPCDRDIPSYPFYAQHKSNPWLRPRDFLVLTRLCPLAYLDRSIL